MVPTLMHDHVYRMGVAWQNTAYNQPPHLGYYLPDYTSGMLTGITNSQLSTVNSQLSTVYDLLGRRLEGLKPGLNIVRKGTGFQKIIIK